MSKATVRYYFGRLNLSGVFDSKHEVLLRTLSAAEPQRYREHHWGVLELAELVRDGSPMLTGYLAKYKPERKVEVAVPERHRLGTTSVQDSITAKARFFLHVKTGIICHRVIGQDITASLFRRQFAAVVRAYNDGFFIDARIETVEDEDRVIRALQSMDVVTRISVDLHPSNPGSRHIWRSLDERMQAVGVGRYREDYSAPEGSRKGLVVDEIVEQRLYMAEDGYGRATVEGTQDGHRRRVSTDDNPATAEASGDDAAAESVLDQLWSSFSDLFERFRS